MGKRRAIIVFVAYRTAADRTNKQPNRLFSDPKIVGPNINVMPEIPNTKPNNLLRLRFSPAIKKWAKINVIKGMIAIKSPAIPEVTNICPLAINQNGNTLPTSPKSIKCAHAMGFLGNIFPRASINTMSTIAPIESLNTTT